MSQTLSFNRMPRIQEPLPQGEVKLPGPPSISPPPKFKMHVYICRTTLGYTGLVRFAQSIYTSKMRAGENDNDR